MGSARSRKGSRAVGAFGVLLALVLVLAGPVAAQFERSNSRTTRLTTAIKRVMRQASLPGATVGVWQQGADPYVRAFGVRNEATGQPMTTDLHVRIGSATKPFIGTAVLQLVDRGKVGLDSPIGKYLKGVPHGNEITVRQLAEMRSGLASYTENPEWQEFWLAHHHRQWTRRQLLGYSFSQPLRFAPGTRFHYSNTNTLLLGQLVRKVSHQPLSAYVRRHILKPARLTDTSIPTGAALPTPRAQGYTDLTPDRARANATRWNPSWAWAAGAMVSTLGDLHRWARVVATGKLLSAATQKQRLRFKPIPNLAGYGGYGFALSNIHGWIGHPGRLPGYETLAAYLPSQKATIVVLINTDINTFNRSHLSTLMAKAVTRVVTPKHVYVDWGA